MSQIMSQPTPSLWYRLRRPLMVVILGLLPFWLFFGTSEQVTVNGAQVRDSSFNFFGLILPLIGLVLAVKMLRKDGSYGEPARWLPRTVLVVLGALLCLFQLGQNLGLYHVDAGRSLRQLKVQLLGPSEPGAQALAPEIDKQMQARTQQRAASIDQVRLRDDIATSLARLQAGATLFNLYAKACDNFDQRFVLDPVPAMLTEQDKAFVEKAVKLTADDAAKSINCRQAAVGDFMNNWLADDILRNRAGLALQVAAYRQRFGDKPAVETPNADLTAGLPVALDDTLDQVQLALRTDRKPTPVGKAGAAELDFPEQGIKLLFNPAGSVAAITVRPPFAGSILGAQLGDSRRTLNRVAGDGWVLQGTPRNNSSAADEIRAREQAQGFVMSWLTQYDVSDGTKVMVSGPIYADYVNEIRLYKPQR
ncbi:hypothetical protein [Bordetella sp. N]|uniref:hypothetical protein n=1 Tax=Bordetella sp. N TaxID=1746199 RepID=UPI000710584F|nr:hypothetical protein [Bordetella sp. N]ALM83095.1 hypothetical protein ASB57_09145 [Bordetella sp. N]